jgi:flavin-dependent dehydrogenase
MAAHPSAEADVLVVGGGPAGAAVAIPLARAGHRVTVVDLGECPAGGAHLLTPLAVSALERLGVEHEQFHRVDGVRVTARNETNVTRWPRHGNDPRFARIAHRQKLADVLSSVSEAAGVKNLRGYGAVSPIVERGFVRGARVIAPDGIEFETRATYTVIADGANSRFGRALGTYREPTWPHALAHVGTFASEFHSAPEIEIAPDLTDRAGTPVTGFGWLFPNGDGTATVGVMMLSTAPSFQVIDPANLWEEFVGRSRDGWRLSGPPIGGGQGGRIPMGLAVGPSAGPTYLLVGDAVGAANPLSGAGIEAALESGMIASNILDEALTTSDASVLQRYPQALADRYGTYYKVGRLIDRFLGRPALAIQVGHLAAGRPTATDAFVRFSTGQFRTGRMGLPEMLYRVARTSAIIAPDA